MKKWKKLLKWIIGLTILIGAGVIFYQSYQLGYQAFSNQSLAVEKDLQETVEIKEGTSQEQVAKKLTDCGMISSKLPFLLRYNLSEYRGKIQPGTYELDGTMGIDDILIVLTQTESAK